MGYDDLKSGSEEFCWDCLGWYEILLEDLIPSY